MTGLLDTCETGGYVIRGRQPPTSEPPWSASPTKAQWQRPGLVEGGSIDDEDVQSTGAVDAFDPFEFDVAGG